MNETDWASEDLILRERATAAAIQFRRIEGELYELIDRLAEWRRQRGESLDPDGEDVSRDQSRGRFAPRGAVTVRTI